MAAEIQYLRVLSVLITVGFLYRFSAILFFFGYSHILLTDITYYQNHFYLIALISLLLFLMPAHHAFSLDAAIRRSLRSNAAPAWTIYALRAQLAFVFFFAGLAKLNYDWLHGEPIRATLELSPYAKYLRNEITIHAIAYIGTAFDLLIAPALLWKRTRLLAYDITLVFHFMNAQIWEIDIFPYLMMGTSLIFFGPNWPRHVWEGLRRVPATRFIPPGRTTRNRALTRREKCLASVLVLYFFVQIVLPLRHFVYPGNVLWTDEGRLFAWRMMTARRQSVMHFFAEDPATGQRWELDLAKFRLRHNLDRLPERMLPRNAVVFANHAASVLKAQGHDYIEIHAEIWTSLHRRKPQLLIDPEVDLTSMRLTLWPATWILPLKEPLPLIQKERDEALQAWLAIGGKPEQW